MADENPTDASSETGSETTAIAPKVKKARAPRRSKSEIEAASVKKAAKVSARRGKVTPPAISAATPAVSKAAKQTAAAAGITVAANDELADLLQLEEENKGLRKALAEKLRAENADLKKRLGNS